jgi:cation diffusion facilitator CzcD-associated flavoprotein CzcO
VKDCASKYAIMPHMRFDAAVAAAAFGETAGSSRLHLKGSTTVTAPAVVSGVGASCLPVNPAIKEGDSFRGHPFHCSR